MKKSKRTGLGFIIIGSIMTAIGTWLIIKKIIALLIFHEAHMPTSTAIIGGADVPTFALLFERAGKLSIAVGFAGFVVGVVTMMIGMIRIARKK